jgi:rhodanese-related sulfurtransferase
MKLYASLLIVGWALIGTSFAQNTARDISIDQVTATLKSHPNALVLDVRTEGEWNGGHMAGAAWMDFLEDDFESQFSKIEKDRPVLIYCAAGGRSASAMKAMARAGFTTLFNVKGGFNAWEDADRPVSNDKPVRIKPRH